MAGPAHYLLMERARRGEFSSAVEVAMVASVTRMTAHRWLVAARIDIGEARLQYLAKVQLKHEQASHPERPRIRAKDMRRQTVGAVKRLNDAQARRKGAKQGP